jgi:hypothetical protein
MQPNNPFRSAAVDYISRHLDTFGFGSIQVVIPDVAILPALYEVFGVTSFEEMFPNGKRDLDKVLPKMIFSWHNSKSVKNNEIEEIGILNEESFSTKNNKTTIYYIEGMLQDDESAKYLDQVIFSEIKGAKANFTNLPSNVLQLMIETGKIIGKDLTSICATNQKMLNFCSKNNYEIFRVRLLKEYDVRYDESWYRNLYSPVELYKKYHTDFLRVEEYDTDQFGAQYFIDNIPVSYFDNKGFNEVTYVPGLFDFFPETIIPPAADYREQPYFLIFDEKAPEESASLYAFEGFLRTFITYGGTPALILSYLKATKRQGQFKDALKRNIDETQNFGHFKFENVELTFVKFTM